MTVTANAKPGGRTLLRPALAAQRRSLLVLAAWSLLEAAPVLLSGQLVAAALDRGFLAGELAAGLAFLMLYGTSMVLGAWAARHAVTPLAAIVEAARDALVRAVVQARLAHAVQGSGPTDASTVARLTRQTEAVRQILATLLMMVRTVVFSLGAALAGLATLLPEMAGVTLGCLAAAGALLALLSVLFRRRYREALVAEERLAGSAGHAVSGLRDVLACGGAGTATRRVGQDVDANAAASIAAARIGSCRIGVVVIGARIPLVATLAMAPWLLRSGAVTPGQVLGAVTYLVSGLEPALRLFAQSLGNMGVQLQVLLRRLADHTAGPPEPPARPGAVSPGPGHIPSLSLRGVTFAYGPHSAPIVDDLDLDVPYGDHLAIVGPSGIGKSTVANLMAGLESCRRGEVALGGTPLAGLAEPWLREAVALVPQESYVFAGTLRENLAYLSPEVSDDELARAADAVGLAPVVKRLGGFDAAIEQAAALSEGERQLITLVRAYVSPARLVILDEATCHLDPAAERRAEEAFAARTGTLIIIAHRISSAMRARRILVLDGQSVRVGDHHALLRDSPLYADLANTWAAAPAGTRA
ncbi:MULTISPECIES: ABC transporter ATP-binding protein [Streptomyces]|uniref:ABC transporter ATP-binding protein n=1 Tax=Streptomyces lycii TaxID=2654337 RepID=A0ABQ7F947_9ACTN|nr:ABC transporter ATP-binding protein [Streptomyces lycii]KAF4405489.1 ABC transporter ATP-binding protein [Streptomyces lycii]